MPVAPGYGDCSVKLVLATLARPAYVTFGINPTATDATTVAGDLKAAWLATGSLNARLDTNVTATEFQVRLGTDGGEDLAGVSTNATAGLLSAATVPPNVAVLCHKRTARGGRRGRGRMFLPWFVNVGDVAETGIIQSATVTSIQTAAAVFIGELSSRSMPMVILHGPGNSSMGAPDVVTTVQVSSLVATQRRRLGRP